MESHLDNKKYYVPEISEFHVGFEYERNGIKNGEKHWYPCIFGENPMILLNGNNEYCLITNRDLENCRVKMLDQSDIESLGWRFGTDDYVFPENKNVTYGQYKLLFNNNELEIIHLSGIIFRGTIKNKSELKVLMKQLGIN